jgi:hypothetical protein
MPPGHHIDPQGIPQLDDGHWYPQLNSSRVRDWPSAARADVTMGTKTWLAPATGYGYRDRTSRGDANVAFYKVGAVAAMTLGGVSGYGFNMSPSPAVGRSSPLWLR